jgi:hypothetical protein
MKLIHSSALVVLLLLTGCITAVSPEKAAAVDLQKSGLVLATIARRGTADDAAKVTVEFYLRPVDGRGSVLKDNVVNSYREMWLLEIPFGRYKIEDWYMAAGTERRASAPHPFEFEVRPGEVTYIGHFEVEVARFPNTFGLRVIPAATPSLVDRSTEDEAAFRAAFPQLKSVPLRNAAPRLFLWLDPTESVQPLRLPPNVTK